MLSATRLVTFGQLRPKCALSDLNPAIEMAIAERLSG